MPILSKVFIVSKDYGLIFYKFTNGEDFYRRLD